MCVSSSNTSVVVANKLLGKAAQGVERTLFSVDEHVARRQTIHKKVLLTRDELGRKLLHSTNRTAR